LILVRKLGVPAEPELAMGAVVDGAVPIVVRNDDVIRITGVGETEFNATRNAELAEIERRRRRYLRDRERADVAGRTAIVHRRRHCDRRDDPLGFARNPHAQTQEACRCSAGSADGKPRGTARRGRRDRLH
jgi:hypothetical protein